MGGEVPRLDGTVCLCTVGPKDMRTIEKILTGITKPRAWKKRETEKAPSPAEIRKNVRGG